MLDNRRVMWNARSVNRIVAMPNSEDYRAIAKRDAALALQDGLEAFSNAVGDKFTVQSLHVLEVIATSPEGVSATSIGERVELTLGGIQRVAARLVTLQFVTADKDDRDARRTTYRLAPRGAAVMNDLHSALVGHRSGEVQPGEIAHLQVSETADLELFRSFGIEPSGNRSFVFGSRQFQAVVAWLREQGEPPTCIRPSPFGGYAVTFQNDGTSLLFFLRWR